MAGQFCRCEDEGEAKVTDSKKPRSRITREELARLHREAIKEHEHHLDLFENSFSSPLSSTRKPVWPNGTKPGSTTSKPPKKPTKSQSTNLN